MFPEGTGGQGASREGIDPQWGTMVCLSVCVCNIGAVLSGVRGTRGGIGLGFKLLLAG